MMSDECKVYLLRRHQGELYGEALFGALGGSATDAGQRKKWLVLAQLERQTKERIQSFLDRAEIAITEPNESTLKGAADALRFAAVDWRDLMRGFRHELEGFVAEFRQAENLDRSGSELDELLRYITAHEEALLQFVRRELAGGGEDSLEAVRRLLHHVHPGNPR